MTNEQIDNLTGRDLEIAIAIAKGAKWYIPYPKAPHVRGLVMPENIGRDFPYTRIDGEYVEWNGDESVPKFSDYDRFVPRYLEPSEAMKLQVEKGIETDCACPGDPPFFYANCLFRDAVGRNRMSESQPADNFADGVQALCTAICRCWLKAHYADVGTK